MTELCKFCHDWGRTITREENPVAITCPDCGRLTWPNLGVNCPAGSAVSLATTAAVYQALRNRSKIWLNLYEPDEPLVIYATNGSINIKE